MIKLVITKPMNQFQMFDLFVTSDDRPVETGKMIGGIFGSKATVKREFYGTYTVTVYGESGIAGFYQNVDRIVKKEPGWALSEWKKEQTQKILKS